jgi:hypothetical protein
VLVRQVVVRLHARGVYVLGIELQHTGLLVVDLHHGMEGGRHGSVLWKSRKRGDE